MDILPPLHIALVSAFLLVTALLLATSSSGLKRADDVILFWRDVRVQPMPFGPVVFLCVMVLLLVADHVTELGIDPLIPVGYILGGLLWLLASLLTPAAILTHHGLIVRSRRGRHRIAWRQVADYFRFEREGRSGFVFFYIDRLNGRRRVEVSVPRRHGERFEEVVKRYVTNRIDRMPEEAFGDTRSSG